MIDMLELHMKQSSIMQFDLCSKVSTSFLPSVSISLQISARERASATRVKREARIIFIVVAELKVHTP